MESDATEVTRHARARPQGSGVACLVVIYGFDLGLRIPLQGSALSVGRDPGNDLALPVQDVSRQHCRFQVRDKEYSVRDLGSTNGTLVNDREIPPGQDFPLSAGDLVALGVVIFKFLDGENVEALYHEEIYRTLMFDGLTGVPNRRYLVEFLEREMARGRRHRRPLTLLLLDVDDFKAINDAAGHLGGDQVLRELAAIIAGQTRRDQCPARFGGDEFAVVMTETALAGARIFAERLRGEVELHEFVADGEVVPVTISIGIESMTPDMSDAEAFLKAADARLYQAKNAGRNRVEG